MNVQANEQPLSEQTILKIAVLAVGGQGGGVLTNWIADLGTRCGYDVQMTSVAGVAQRAGATIYYVEMAPRSEREPVFALSPSPGDVDILIAAELMEAGRAVLRGFVTPDRTTLIASSHRVLAVAEKEVPGDGRSDAQIVDTEITRAALRSVCFDMEEIAAQAGTMISASLFGGLAKSGALPFAVAEYEAVIQASNRGVQQSLNAFRSALEYVPQPAPKVTPNTVRAEGPSELVSAWNSLTLRLEDYPETAQSMLQAGLQKVVDYQDVSYGSEYLDRVALFSQHGPLTDVAAKYIANAMCYDDLPKVADLKVRQSRARRLRQEQNIGEEDIAHVTEYFHPRGHEVCATLPARLGAWIEAHPIAFRLLDRAVNRGRRLRTDGFWGFGVLWCISSLRPYRRRLYRHTVERAHLDKLVQLALTHAQNSPDIAAEILKCQRLIKGYSDTHARGHSKFSRVIGLVPELAQRSDAAAWIARLRTAALQDEDGVALDGAIATVQSFTGPENP